MAVAERRRRHARGAAAAAAAAVCAAACAPLPYAHIVISPPAGLPPDAFARCHEVLLTRYGRLVVTDPAAFRLRTDWAPLPDPEVPGQQRATVFADPEGIGLVVEVRYLDKGWFGALPRWTDPRPDARLERLLEQVLAAALAREAVPRLPADS